MTRIEKILTTTRVSEANGVMQQIIDQYKKGDYSTDEYLTKIFEDIIELNNQLGTAIMRDKAESELATLDNVTDNEVTLTHELVEGYTCHPNEAIAGQATTLFSMVDKYGLAVKNKSFNEEYPLLASMIDESKTEPYASCVAGLDGVAERFNLLEAAVNTFNTRRSAFYSVRDNEKEQASATEIKKLLIAAVNDNIASYLNAMQKARPDVFAELAQFMANRIAENNAAVRNRRTKNDDK